MTTMKGLALIKGGEVYDPQYIGKKDILIGGSSIIAIEDSIELTLSDCGMKVIDATGKWVTPGFVDSLVHSIGGGGEGGFRTRTPEMYLSDAVLAGVTTVIGALGTDSVTRTLSNLIAKTYSLREEGISSYCYAGSYHLPPKTITGSLQSDIALIDPVIGVGEVAISDHRAPQPSPEALVSVAADARVGGMLSGKSGVVSVHVGDGDAMLNPLREAVAGSDIPITQFYPTHINRTERLLVDGIAYAKEGGYIDLTASTTPEILAEGEVKCSTALARLLKQGVSESQITFSSDGHASLPHFDTAGNLLGLKVGSLSSLLSEVKDAVLDEGIQLAMALKVVTSNPAKVLKLHQKGRLSVGCDADILVLDPESFRVESVMAMGQLMLHEGELKIKGTFE